LSQASLRLGQLFFSAKSFAAASSSGRTLSDIGDIQSEPRVHFWPSHWAT
jgi:hypothetical protein